MLKKIVIINEETLGAAYGIGKYLEQLIQILKGSFEFVIVHIFHSNSNEIQIINNSLYDVLLIPYTGKYNDRNLKRYYRNIAYILKIMFKEKNEQYQLIFLLNYISAKKEFPLALRKQFECRIILTVHYTNWSIMLNGDLEKLKGILYKPDEELTDIENQVRRTVIDDTQMMQQCDKIICIANHTTKYIKDVCNIQKEKISLINNGIINEFTSVNIEQLHEIRSFYMLPENAQIIIYAGRLDHIKGISFLIKALKKLIRQNPNCYLIIAGAGDFKRYIEESYPLNTRILFTGHLPKEELYKLYKIADVGVVCSIHEEFGYVAIEMMMHKIPIVVSDTGGLSEIIDDGICGYKIPFDSNYNLNTDILAERISDLLNNQDKAKKLKTKAYEKFLQKYELTVFKNNFINLINKIR